MHKTFSSAARIFINSISILASDVTNRVATFITYALVARFLGTLEFGQLALAFTFFQTFQMLAVAGLQSYITREVSKDHDKTHGFLLNGGLVVTATSLLSMALLCIFVNVMQYAPATRNAIMLLSIGLPPFSLAAVCDALFQAREQMKYITYANIIVNIVRISGVFLVLLWWQSLPLLIVFFILTHALNLSLKLAFLLPKMKRAGARIEVQRCLKMVKSSTTFLGINGVNAAMGSFNVILLSKFTDEIQVGIFSAAHQLLTPISLLFESIVVGVYPVMCRSFESGLDKLKQMTQKVWEILLAIVLPAAITLFFLSNKLFVFIYGNEDFSQSAQILQIIVWILILRASSKVLGVALIASFREKKTLQILTIDLIAMIILGFLLISQFGIIGSAITLLSVRIVDFIQHYVPVARMFKKFPLHTPAWKSCLSVCIMALFLLYLQNFNIFGAAIVANFIYLFTLAGIVYLAVGNLEKVKIRYLTLYQTE